MSMIHTDECPCLAGLGQAEDLVGGNLSDADYYSSDVPATWGDGGYGGDYGGGGSGVNWGNIAQQAVGGTFDILRRTVGTPTGTYEQTTNREGSTIRTRLSPGQQIPFQAGVMRQETAVGTIPSSPGSMTLLIGLGMIGLLMVVMMKRS